MITQANFKDVLRKLSFTESKDIFTRYFPDIDVLLQVDFKKQKLIYPINKGFKVSGEFTTGFTQNENFVVFECVNCLFEKGYKPEHIELEPKWKVGHGASGGRADIMIKDNNGKALLIIECKTAGDEFKGAWQDTLMDGGQLITYAKQEGDTEFITLYTSDYSNNEVTRNYYLITIKDNSKLLEELADKKPLSYEKAKGQTKADIFKAWKDTYSQEFSTRGIFEDDASAYQIGKTKYTLADLKSIGHEDIQKKYNEFATILRKHNVSGRENAFDRLVNLFLCKIVDETNNPDGLKFYWKGIAYDSYFDLQDRLLQLYKDGMSRFLNEDVTYIDNEKIDRAFKFFKKDPDATKDKIKQYFRQLKFFTNNDFAFIDVHNEKLFYQNAKILLEILQMMQDIRLKTTEQNQFLGDLFEGFLDQGVKQSEGQFFTPMPIVKFILKSLPLEQIINESDEIPKMIDFACGAGHFLNEYAQSIKPLVEKQVKNDLKDYYANITGIEKEYRLSKVSKVSSFMYGQDDINIVYADALADNPEIKDGTYSVLVSNPPFAVKGFLDTLKDTERKKYELLDSVSKLSANNNIETFFLERVKQLLKPGGVAGIIAPVSILTNGSVKSTSNNKNINVTTREIILKYFDLVAIAEPGGGTFGRTETNTIILFLRRKDNNPEPAEQFQNRVDAWFRSDKTKNGIFEDEHLIRQYCNRVEFDFNDYQTLLTGAPNQALLDTEIFKEYQSEFDKWTEIINLKKQKVFSAKTPLEQTTELQKRFVPYVKKVEKDKLYYYILASQNPQDVAIIRSPTKKEDRREFLGFDWSRARGNEGIQYYGKSSESELNHIEDDEEKRILNNINNLDSIDTPLYDPQNNHNPAKLNGIVEAGFIGQYSDVPDTLAAYVTVTPLADLIQFKTIDFSKSINLTPLYAKKKINSKWEIVKLGDVVDVKIGGTPSRKTKEYFKGKNLWVSILEMNGQSIFDTKEKITETAVKNSNVKLIPKGTTLLSFKLSIGKTAIAGQELYTNEAIAGLIPKNIQTVTDGYLFQFFNSKMIDLESEGYKAFGKSLNSYYLNKEVQIPLPPLEVQKQIVDECLKIDKEFEQAEASIKAESSSISIQINKLSSGSAKIALVTIVSINKSSFDPTKENKEFTYVDIESVENETGIISFDKKIIGLRAPSRARRLAEIGSTIISTVRPNLRGFAFINYQPDNTIYSTGFAVLHSKDEKAILNKMIFLNFMYSDDLMSQMTKAMPKTQYPSINLSDLQKFTITVPPIKKQKKVIQVIEKCEEKIKAAREIINGIAKRKEETIKKYL